jgi:tRNA(Ile)-lysidine synthase
VTPDAALRSSLGAERDLHPFDTVTVAVSGGGDSTALLLAAHDWGGEAGVTVHAVTVDHGLRPEAAGEARMVADLCAARGIAHETLRWTDWDGQGNLQSAARTARYDLLAEAGGGPILLGHTQDDVAETFLMRLARGSGVDGLARMRASWDDRGRRWLRPFLGVTRAALRDWLRARDVTWVEDPTNDDPAYDRVKMRAALELLSPLGIDADRLATTAEAMGEARTALTLFAHREAVRIARVEAGDVVFDAPPLEALPAETRDRLLAHAIGWVTGATYRPRRRALIAAAAAARETGKATLGGSLLTRRGETLRVAREYRAVADLETSATAPWDGRWRMVAPDRPWRKP